MSLRGPLLILVVLATAGACGPVGKRTVRVEAGAEPSEDGGSGGGNSPGSGGATGGARGAGTGGGTGGAMEGTGGSTGGSGGAGGGTGGSMGGTGGVIPPDAAPDGPRGTGGMDTMLPRDAGPDLAPDVAAPTSTLAMGLVSRWKLDEGTGNTAKDSVTASANDGMLSGATSWAPAGFPMAKYPNTGALTFSGGVMDVGVKGMPSLTESTSIALWVNYASAPGTTQPIIGFGASGAGRLKIGVNMGQLAAWKGMGSTVLVGTAAPAGGWHHVTYTFDGTTRRLYLDGTLRASSGMAGETGAVAEGHVGGYGTQMFAGTVDEIRVYDRALTAGEVMDLASGAQ